MRYFLIFVLIVLLLVCISIIRTLTIKPTRGYYGKTLPFDNDRARLYGKTLSQMVKKETISSRFDSDPSKFIQFQDLLKDLFPKVFTHCEISHPGNGLVVHWKSKNPNGEPILLMSHHDVVAADNNGWQYPPFSGEIVDDVIWGRGTVDTKSSLMAELQALEELISSGFEPQKDIYVTSGCTEEWSGPCASAIVQSLKDNNVHIGVLIDEGGSVITEPITGIQGKYCVVGVVEKGYGDLRFTAKSNGGHSSTPKKNSPLVRLGKFMVDVDKHSPFKPKMSATLQEMLTRLGPNANFGLKLLFTNLWLYKPLLTYLLPKVNPTIAAMMQTTIAFTMAKGADGLNVLPSEAYVTANLRFIHHQSNEQCLKILRKKAEKYGIEMEVIYQDYPCTPVDYKSKEFKKLQEVANKVFTDYGVVPYVMTGGTDAKYYDSICSNCFRFAPVEINKQQLASIHGVNENVNQSVLVRAVDFYKEMLISYCNE